MLLSLAMIVVPLAAIAFIPGEGFIRRHNLGRNA